MTGKLQKTDDKAQAAAFVLQDHKRLPARFFACLAGAPTCRAA